MSVVSVIAGILLAWLALRDIFHTLFHPGSQGRLSSRVAAVVWRLFRWGATRRRSLLELAGPAALLSVIATWTLLLVFAGALVYFPWMPGHFVLAQGLVPSQNGGFGAAVYTSAVTLATLGYGDVVPTTTALRLVAPAQALVGFALLSASLTWTLSLYPVLARRRELAREVQLLGSLLAARSLRPVDLGSATLNEFLLRFTRQLIAARGDLSQFPVSYYFHPRDLRSALPPAIRLLYGWGVELQDAEEASVRFGASMLLAAISEFCDELQGVLRPPPGGDAAAVLRAYETDHLVTAGP